MKYNMTYRDLIKELRRMISNIGYEITDTDRKIDHYELDEVIVPPALRYVSWNFSEDES